MSKRIEIPKPAMGYGYVGAWKDGDIGWGLPNALHDRRSGPREDFWGHKNVRTFLCKITIEPVTDVDGRPITRIAAKDKP